MMPPGTLFVVGTPIGNMEDMTERAVRVLREADAVLCEDTRTTKKLLDRYGIKVPTISYHSKSSSGKHDAVLAMLEEGKNLALVSDAGTPAISDPGVMLVSQVYERFGGNARVAAVPGPSALVSALSISGLPASEFTFLGFLPHKKGRQTLFREIADSSRTVAFYESPHRAMKTLGELAKLLDSSRTVAVARELTKIYEEVVRGSAAEVLERFASRPDAVRGEFTIIVGGR